MKKEKLYKILGVVLVIILFISTAAISFKLGMNHANYETQSKENTTDKKEKDESIEKNPQEESDKKDEQEEPNKPEESNKQEQPNKQDEDEKLPKKDGKLEIVGKRYEEFDNIIKESVKEKELKTVPGYESFYMNRIHAPEPGGWGSGMPERYFFNDNGTYLFVISEYDVGNTEVLRAGTWEIKDGKLELREKYVLTEVNGTLTDVSVPGGDTGKGYIDYDFEVKPSTIVKTYSIKNIGVSSYKKDMNEEENKKIIPDEYKLDAKYWYSLENESEALELSFVSKYYDLIK